MAAYDSRTARSARRRRRLVIYGARTDRPEPAGAVPSIAWDSAAEVEVQHAPATTSPAAAVPRSARILPSYGPHDHEPSSSPNLRRLLDRPDGLTWMLVGDSLEPAANSGRDWRSFGGRLTETIRHAMGRARDVVIDRLVPGQLLSQTAAELADAASRFRPELVLFSLGPQEADAGRRGLPAFERTLLDLFQLLSMHGALPILCTPPRLPTIEAEATVDQLIYAEAVRSIAAEYDLPLVDHFAHWEAAAASAKGNAGWFDSSAPVPGRYGHQQLAQRIVTELALAPTVAAH